MEAAIGDVAVLSCSASPNTIIAKKTFCTFLSPSGDILNLEPGVSHEFGRISYGGKDVTTECGVKINRVVEKDYGDWR